MVEFPVDLPLAQMLLKAEELMFNEILTVIAMLSVPPIWFRPKDREENLTQRERSSSCQRATTSPCSTSTSSGRITGTAPTGATATTFRARDSRRAARRARSYSIS